MKTILVATDFSKSAENACKYAIEMAKEFNASIILVHVLAVPIIASDVTLTTMQMDYAIMHDVAARNFKRHIKKISRQAMGIEIIPELRTGSPGRQLIAVARERKADLIITGAKGKSFLEKTLLGSTAWRILRNAPCRVLVVPDKTKYKVWKKILYVTDLAKDSIAHVKNLVPLANRYNSEILFLNVNPIYFSEKVRELEKAMDKIIKQLRYTKISGYSYNDWDTAARINDFISSKKVDCLCLLTRKKTLLRKLFGEGSITKKLVFHTSVPLLVLHEKDYISRKEIESRKP